jgi:hypothetical protein
VVVHGESRYLVECLCHQGAVYIFGAGHISRKLAPLTSLVGFLTVVLDDREEFANRGRFETADEIIVPDSFEIAEPYYLQTGVSGTITQKVSPRWDVQLTGGRYQLDYQPAA